MPVLARDAPRVAALFADRVIRATDRLADYPRLGRVVPESGLEDLREVILGGYRVTYQIRRDQVQVVTVHHGARLLDAREMEGGA